MRTRLLWLLLAAFTGGACVVDEYFVDELTVTLEAPLDALGVDDGYTVEGNQTMMGCAIPLPHVPIEADYLGPGPHALEITTESEFQRSVRVQLHAWEDVDGDGKPGCDELGVRAHVDLAAEAEVVLPRPDQPPEPGGASDQDCGGDDDSAR